MPAMSFIAMELLGEYPEMDNGNCNALTNLCLLTSFVYIILIKDKKTESVINAYIKYTYADKADKNLSSLIMGKNSLVHQ